MATICTPNVSVSSDSSLQIWRDWTLVWSGNVLGLQNKFYWCHWSDVVKGITRPIITWSEYLRSSVKMVTSGHCFLSSFSKQWTYFLSGSATQNVGALIEQKSRDELVAAVLHLLDVLQNCNKSWLWLWSWYFSFLPHIESKYISIYLNLKTTPCYVEQKEQILIRFCCV